MNFREKKCPIFFLYRPSSKRFGHIEHFVNFCTIVFGKNRGAKFHENPYKPKMLLKALNMAKNRGAKYHESPYMPKMYVLYFDNNMIPEDCRMLREKDKGQ